MAVESARRAIAWRAPRSVAEAPANTDKRSLGRKAGSEPSLNAGLAQTHRAPSNGEGANGPVGSGSTRPPRLRESAARLGGSPKRGPDAAVESDSEVLGTTSLDGRANTSHAHQRLGSGKGDRARTEDLRSKLSRPSTNSHGATAEPDPAVHDS